MTRKPFASKTRLRFRLGVYFCALSGVCRAAEFLVTDAGAVAVKDLEKIVGVYGN